jgi:predicted nucleic-acid-binding protein
VIGLDTSVVLRLLVGEPADQAEKARALLSQWRELGEQPPLISDLVVGESYFVLLHHYEVPHRDAIKALGMLLGDPRIEASGVAKSVLDTMTQSTAGAGLMDRLIHGDYVEIENAQLVTFDRAAARLSGARLL